MSIVAVCPYCQQGKIRAPDRAIGLSTRCPRCRTSFTIFPREVTEKEPVGKAGSSDDVTAAEDSPLEPVVLPAMPALPAAALVVAPTSGAEAAYPVALIAFIIGGLSVLASQFPYGRFVATGMAGVGLVVGLISLVMADRKKLIPALSSAFNLFVIVLVVLLPSWLGLGPWRGYEVHDQSRVVVAVAADGTSKPAEWVEAGLTAWQLNDVRVSVSSIKVTPLEVTGPNKQKRPTKEKYLQITMRVANEGVARKIDFTGWGGMSSAPDGSDLKSPRLTDQAGKVLAMKPYPAGAEPPGRVAKGLFPGRSAEEVLLFEPPTASASYLRLELPGSAFGGTEPVRFQIPQAMIYWAR
jgi:hypothetical protein